MAYIISADELKKTLPGYTPALSEEFHKRSAQLADKQYQEALRDRPEKTVLLMAGGAASGKSEYVSVYLENKEAIIFDGTLPTLTGAKNKIRAAKRAHKEIEIHLVVPESFFLAFLVFLNRDRKFDESHFYRTHSNSRKTVLEIAKEFPEIPITIIWSNYKNAATIASMSFSRLEIDNDHQDLIEILQTIQYDEAQIRKIVEHDAQTSITTFPKE
ncbi:MAG: hypothetical protein ABJA67_03655 [Chthonomonadales bacterium]